MAVSYGCAGHLTANNGGFRPAQIAALGVPQGALRRAEPGGEEQKLSDQRAIRAVWPRRPGLARGKRWPKFSRYQKSTDPQTLQLWAF